MKLKSYFSYRNRKNRIRMISFLLILLILCSSFPLYALESETQEQQETGKQKETELYEPVDAQQFQERPVKTKEAELLQVIPKEAAETADPMGIVSNDNPAADNPIENSTENQTENTGTTGTVPSDDFAAEHTTENKTETPTEDEVSSSETEEEEAVFFADGLLEEDFSEEILLLSEKEAFSLNDLDSGFSVGIQYWNSELEAWQEIPDTPLPSNVRFRLLLNYELFTSQLTEAGGKLVYTLPSQLQGLVSQGNLLDDGEVIGELRVTDSAVLIEYDLNKIDTQKHHFAGSSNVVVEIRKDSIPQDGEISLDNIDISIHLEPDSFYKDIGLDLKKDLIRIKYQEDGDYYYADYKVALTAEKNIEKAMVTDRFLSGGRFVDSYLEISGEETEILSGSGEMAGFLFVEQSTPDAVNTVYTAELEMEPPPAVMTIPISGSAQGNTLIWSAYGMRAGETRILHYRVRLTEEFQEQTVPEAFLNQVDSYAASVSEDHDNIYHRDSDQSFFEIHADIELKKTDSQVLKDETGREYAEFTVNITAPEDNTYTITDLTIHDWFGADTQNSLLYDWDSFTLDAKPCSASPGTESWGNCAEIKIETMAPGEVRVLKYRVWIDPSCYTSLSGLTDRTNSVQTVVHDRIHNTEKWMDNKTFGKIYPLEKQWRRKSVNATPTPADQKVSMNGTVYDRNGRISSVKEFTIPAKSYQYQVLVNEDGGWDVSSATFLDTMDSKMAYVGYVKVEAVDVSSAAWQSGSTDAAAFQKIAELPAIRTAWLQVDGKSSFSFTPASLGFPAGEYAYRLVYYAKSLVSVTTTVRNEFRLIGPVGYGGKGYALSISAAGTDLSIVGTQQCKVNKEFWYYTLPDDEENFYEDRITHYWIVRADGDLVEGLKMKDIPYRSCSISHDPVVGVYRGKKGIVPDPHRYTAGSLENPDNLAELGWTKLEEGSDYEGGTDTITLLKNQVLDTGEELIVIFRTRFIYDIAGGSYKDYYTVTNRAAYSYDNGSSWKNANDASIVTYNHKGNQKEADQVYSYDGRQWSELATGKPVTLPPPENPESGIFVSWLLKVNIVGRTSGKAVITDSIPEGLELEYISLQSIGTWLDGNEPLRAEPEAEDLSGNFISCPMRNEGVYLYRNPARGYVMDGEQYYYDKTGGKAVWAVDRLRTYNNQHIENYFVTFRIVCRVKDVDFRDGKEHSFTNIADIRSSLGKDRVESENHFSISTMQKTGNESIALTTGIYPFTIHANPTALDLNPKGDNVVLVDELNSALAFQPETLVITNMLTNEVLTSNDYRVTISREKGKTFVEFTLPDAMALQIQYRTRITAAPETKVTVSNIAYWKWYPATEDTEVISPDFQYEISGTGSTYSTYATLKIIKKSSGNLMVPPISGAEYKLYPISLNRDGTLTEGKALDGTMKKENGTYMFDFLHYNTIYRVREEKPPEGYLLDEASHYVAIANAKDVLLYQALLQQIADLESREISVDGCYTSDTLEITLLDEPDFRYSLTVRKQDGDTGEPLIGVGFRLYREAREGEENAVSLHTTSGIRSCVPVSGDQLTLLDAQGYASVTFTDLMGDGSEEYYLAETKGLVGYLSAHTAISLSATSRQEADGRILSLAVIKGIEKEFTNRELEITISNYAKLDMPVTGSLFTENHILTAGLLLIVLALYILLYAVKQQYIKK